MASIYALRPATEADREWVRQLRYTVYRPVVEQQFGWDQAWQDANFDRTFDPATLQIVQVDSEDAGLLSVEWRRGEVFLSGIEIAPMYQGRGLGTAIIRDLQRQAHAERLPITLRVLFDNDRAHALYQRLGFTRTGQTETHHLMRWQPPPDAA